MTTTFRIDDGHDLKFQVHFVLSRNPYIKNRDIQFDVIEEEVVLKGIVRTYYQKQMAQESLRKVEGIRRITNDLAVVGV